MLSKFSPEMSGEWSAGELSKIFGEENVVFFGIFFDDFKHKPTIMFSLRRNGLYRKSLLIN